LNESIKNNMTKFAFFDLDQTLYDGFSTVDFYFLMAESGWIDKNVYNEDRLIRESYQGTIESYDSITKKVISLGINKLKDYTRAQVIDMENEFLAVSLKLYSYTRPLISLLHEQGFICYLISAAIFPPVEAVGRELNMPFLASTGKMKDNTYTGELNVFLNGEEKRKAVKKILSDAGQPTFSLAFGDSTGDLPFLEAADKAFVINPHQEEMKELAREKGYALVNGENIIKVVQKEINH
jgi:HAD superfamily hydrolase (TIGR01490 family)